MRGAGGKAVGKRTRGELQKEWYELKYRPQLIDEKNPYMGTVTNEDPDVLGWVAYHNSMVTDEWKLSPNNPKHMEGDPDGLFDHMTRNVPNFTGELRQRAIKQLKEKYPRWMAPPSNGVTASPDPTYANPGAPIGDNAEITSDKVPKPIPGMLPQSRSAAPSNVAGLVPTTTPSPRRGRYPPITSNEQSSIAVSTPSTRSRNPRSRQ